MEMNACFGMILSEVLQDGPSVSIPISGGRAFDGDSLTEVSDCGKFDIKISIDGIYNEETRKYMRYQSRPTYGM